MNKITNDHLSRAAYVYIRQSTPGQLINNKESRRRQYGLAERAKALGWQKVNIIDEDLGRSGDGKFPRHRAKVFCTDRWSTRGKRLLPMWDQAEWIKERAASIYCFLRTIKRPPQQATSQFPVAFGFRSIKLPGMSDAGAHAYAQTLKLYPLSDAANPKPTRFFSVIDANARHHRHW